MGNSAGSLLNLVLPTILLIFLGLYLLGLLSGVEPELALARAGLAGLVLAVLGRMAGQLLEHLPPPPNGEAAASAQRVDAVIDDSTEVADAPHNPNAASRNCAIRIFFSPPSL